MGTANLCFREPEKLPRLLRGEASHCSKDSARKGLGSFTKTEATCRTPHLDLKSKKYHLNVTPSSKP